MQFFSRKPLELPTRQTALPDRAEAIAPPAAHFVNGRSLAGPYPDGMETVTFGLGCFWGAERMFWGLDGVYVTAVGYAAGMTVNPTYEDVCTGRTGHNEVVLVVYDPAVISFDALLKTFFESHDPTQGMRQGNDVGTQYRSGIYVSGADRITAAQVFKEAYAAQLAGSGFGLVTTEILPEPVFYFAEDYHQQYLAKNPHGYCGLGGTGIACQMPARQMPA